LSPAAGKRPALSTSTRPGFGQSLANRYKMQ
jgi:hypothetical protein